MSKHDQTRQEYERTVKYLRGLQARFKAEVKQTVGLLNKRELDFALREFGGARNGEDSRQAMRRHLLNVSA